MTGWGGIHKAPDIPTAPAFGAVGMSIPCCRRPSAKSGTGSAGPQPTTQKTGDSRNVPRNHRDAPPIALFPHRAPPPWLCIRARLQSCRKAARSAPPCCRTGPGSPSRLRERGGSPSAQLGTSAADPPQTSTSPIPALPAYHRRTMARRKLFNELMEGTHTMAAHRERKITLPSRHKPPKPAPFAAPQKTVKPPASAPK